LLKFCVKILFWRHYFRPLNTFLRNGRIRDRIRIRTSDYWIRIRKAQKHADPDPVPDPDPQHFLKVYYFIIFRCEKEEDLAMIAAQQYYIEFATDMNAER
jgi:hypothetical protein